MSEDDYGNDVFTTTNITVKGCFLGFSGNTEEIVDPVRDAVDYKVTIYFPRKTVIEDGDVFVVRGSEFVKDGAAKVWENPFNLPSGVVVPIRKRNG